MKKIYVILLLIALLIQIYRPDFGAAPIDSTKDFISVVNPPEEVSRILQKSCYDCHSNQTTLPWYGHVAPVSWWVANHVKEGKKHLNFSDWADFSDKKKDHKLEEIIEEVEEKVMPMSSYVLMHGEAELTEEEVHVFCEWFNKFRNK